MLRKLNKKGAACGWADVKLTEHYGVNDGLERQTADRSICGRSRSRNRRGVPFTTEDIHNHLRMASRLTHDRPVQLKIVPLGVGQFEFTIVGLDYFSELSII